MVGKGGRSMRRKRTAVRTKKRSVAVLGIRSAAIGIAVGIGLCALLAALVKSGVISQGGIGIAGSAAAAGMVFMSGMTYGMMAEERKVLFASIGGAGMLLLALLGNLLFIGQMRAPLVYVAAATAAVGVTALRAMRPKKRAARRK